MVCIAKIALSVASAACLVSAGPAVRALAETIVVGDDRPVDGPEVDVSLIRRADDARLQKRDGTLICGSMSTANFPDVQLLLQQNENNRGLVRIIPAKSCQRTRCRNTSGLYVCNDRATKLYINDGEIADHMQVIQKRCCQKNRWGDDFAPWRPIQMGGQQFTDALGGGWNAIIAYADCSHPENQAPDTYNRADGSSPNGLGCQYINTYIS